MRELSAGATFLGKWAPAQAMCVRQPVFKGDTCEQRYARLEKRVMPTAHQTVKARRCKP